MLKKYNIAADLLVLANAYYNKGQKKDAVKLFVRAMDEGDSEELINDLDEANQALDPTVVEENEEVLSDEAIEDILNENEEVESEADEDEESEEPEEVEEVEETEEELPELDEVVSKVEAKKATLANLSSLSGKTAARKAAMAKFLRKK